MNFRTASYCATSPKMITCRRPLKIPYFVTAHVHLSKGWEHLPLNRATHVATCMKMHHRTNVHFFFFLTEISPLLLSSSYRMKRLCVCVPEVGGGGEGEKTWPDSISPCIFTCKLACWEYAAKKLRDQNQGLSSPGVWKAVWAVTFSPLSLKEQAISEHGFSLQVEEINIKISKILYQNGQLVSFLNLETRFHEWQLVGLITGYTKQRQM